MRILDRYIFFQWLQMFVLTVIVTTGILLMEDMYKELTNLLAYGVTFKGLCLYYVLIIPRFLGVVVPVSFLISLLYILNQLHQNQELVAMRAAGMSLWQMLRSLWFVGVGLTLLMFVLNAKVIPSSMELHREYHDNLKFEYQRESHAEEEVGIVFNLAYDSPETHRRWFMNRFSEYSYRGYGVTLFMLDDSGQERYRYMAREAYFDDVDGHWIFLDGRKMKFDPTTGDPIKSIGFAKKSLDDVRDSPEMMQALRRRPKFLSFWELQTVKSSFSDDTKMVAPYVVRYYSMLLNPLMCLILVGIAIPFSISGVRTNPMVGISKAMGLFFLFYLINSVSTLLGEQNLIGPFLAACVPDIFIGALTVYLYSRVLKI